jgi:hypothetical protein
VKVQAKGQPASVFYHSEDHFHLSELSPGEHGWAVAVVCPAGQDVDGQDTYALVSEESDWWTFTIAPPSPIVHSISPTSTFKGTGVTVVISGENFTHSLVLTISVPLQAAFVNSSTITATIPTTLEVGGHPVIVTDSNGKGTSHASFTVEEKPTPTPTRPPKTPMPTTPVYPPPVLQFKGIIGCNVTFAWQWSRTLGKDEYFAVRVWREGIDPHESVVWTDKYEYTHIPCEKGDYTWEVAICRGDPGTHICEQLAVNKGGTFWFGGDKCCVQIQITETIPP